MPGLSLTKLEGLHYFLGEAITAGVFPGTGFERSAANTTLDVLTKAIAAIKSAAPDPAAHLPRMFCMMGRPVRIGCSCAWFPPKASKRMSTMGNDYLAHMRRLNLDGHRGLAQPMLYADGPYKGKTWEQAYAEDGAAKL